MVIHYDIKESEKLDKRINDLYITVPHLKDNENLIIQMEIDHKALAGRTLKLTNHIVVKEEEKQSKINHYYRNPCDLSE